MYYQRLQISTLAVVAVLLLPLFLFAEVRTSSDTNGDGYGDSTAHEEVRTTTITTSDQEANVCDGVTCPDGSCAATPEECPVMEGEVSRYVDTERSRDMEEPISADESASIVPIRAEIEPASEPDYLDIDDDGDGIPTRIEADRATPYTGEEMTERERVQQSMPTDVVRQDDDEVGNGDEVIEKAKNYNSTRSNRRKNVFDDADLDKVPDVARTRAGFIKFDGVDGESRAAHTLDDGGSLWCWGRAEGALGTEYRWGRGLCIALAATEDADDAAKDRISALLVQGDEVRGWSEEEREAWRAYRAERAEEDDLHEQLMEHIIERVQENERIQEMRADDASVAMEYRTTLRLFGFIPLQRTVTARMDVESAEPKLSLPWYSFLTTKPEKETIRTLVLDTMDILVRVPARAS